MADIAGSVLGPRIVLVTDKSVRKLGLASAALESLSASDVEVAVFDDVAADPPEKNVRALVDFIQDRDATGVLAVGGGSTSG